MAAKVSPARTTKSPTATAGFDQAAPDLVSASEIEATGLPRSPNLLGYFAPDHRTPPGPRPVSRGWSSKTRPGRLPASAWPPHSSGLLVLPIIDTAHRAPLSNGESFGSPGYL